MRSSCATLFSRITSTFFAVALVFGLLPATAFAAENDIVDDASIENIAEEINTDEADAADAESDSVLADEIINQTQPLELVAQQESTRSYFLAQTLESTRTVPVVSAQLPIDTGVSAEPATPAEGDSEDPTEAGDDSDESDLGGSIAAESTVVGSFEYRGITYAVEPGGDSVAVVAADYAKLPTDFTEAHIIVLPSQVSSNDIDFYSVTRIADSAFAPLGQADPNLGTPIYSAVQTLSDDVDEVIDQRVIATGDQNDIPSRVISTEASDSERSGEISSEEDVVAEEATGITMLTIPASVVAIEDDALTGFNTLQYVIVSPENPNYSSYDGVLYNADQTSLLPVPEGRTGTVCVASSTQEFDQEVFSHCASLDALVVDADSAASRTFENVELYNVQGDAIEVRIAKEDDQPTVVQARGSQSAELRVGEIAYLYSEMSINNEIVPSYVASNDILTISESGSATACSAGSSEIATFLPSKDGAALLVSLIRIVVNGDVEGAEEVFNVDVASTSTETIRATSRDDVQMESRAALVASATSEKTLPISGDTYLQVKNGGGRAFMYVGSGFAATATWTGLGTSTPSPGDLVNITVTNYRPNGGETTRENIVNAGRAWNSDTNKELIGIRNTQTGSYIDIDSMYSGKPFSFSFIMESGTTISSKTLKNSPATSTFEPVYKTHANAIVYNFHLNGPTVNGKKIYGKWYCAATETYGHHNGSEHAGTTYAEVGDPVEPPSSAIPTCEGYTFLGWYDKPEDGKGSIVPKYAVLDDGDVDNDGNPNRVKNYYAHWKKNSNTTAKSIAGNTYLQVKNGGGRAFMYVGSGFAATYTWAGSGTSAPANGDIVSVTVTNYRPNGGETTRENIVNAGRAWNSDTNKELIGIRNTQTGSYIDIDSMYSGKPFSFSFIMESGTTISSTALTNSPATSTFEPVYKTHANAIVYNFHLNGPTVNGKKIYGKWYCAATDTYGHHQGSEHAGTTYAEVGDPVEAPSSAIPTCAGYVFLGWYDDPTTGSLLEGVASGNPGTIKNYYAHWGTGATTYFFAEYKGNGATSGSMPIAAYEVGKSFTIAGCGFVRTGYTFDSWNSDAAGTGTRYEVGTELKSAMTAGASTTLYAKWTMNSYDFSFKDIDAAGMETIVDATKVNIPYEVSTTEKKMVGLPDAPASKAGYTFLGWSQKKYTKDEMLAMTALPEGDWAAGASVAVSDLVVGKDTICKPQTFSIYAVYKLNTASATFKTPSGYTFKDEAKDAYSGFTGVTLSDDKTTLTIPAYSVDETIAMPAASTINIQAGYKLSGWNEEGQSGMLDTDYVIENSAQDRTLTAVINRESDYAITYNKDGGDWVEPFTGNQSAPSTYNVDLEWDGIAFPHSTFVLPAIEKDGYHFSGWTGGNAASNGCISADKMTVTVTKGATTGDLSFTATWTPVLYTITLSAGTTQNGDQAAFSEALKNGYTAVTGAVYNPSSKPLQPTVSSDGRTFTIPFTIESADIMLPTVAASADVPVNMTLAGGWRLAGWLKDGADAGRSVTIPTGSFGDKAYEASWSAILRITLPVGDGTQGSSNSKTLYLDRLTGRTGTDLYSEKNDASKVTDMEIISYSPIETVLSATSIAPSTVDPSDATGETFLPNDEYVAAFFDGSATDVQRVIDSMKFKVLLRLGTDDHELQFPRRASAGDTTSGAAVTMTIPGQTSYATTGQSIKGTLDLLLDTSLVDMSSSTSPVRIKQMNDVDVSGIASELQKLSTIVWTVSAAPTA